MTDPIQPATDVAALPGTHRGLIVMRFRSAFVATLAVVVLTLTLGVASAQAAVIPSVSVTVSGTAVTLAGTVRTDRDTQTVTRLGIEVQSTSGMSRDFELDGGGPVRLGTTPTALHFTTTLPAGTYTYRIRYLIGDSWSGEPEDAHGFTVASSTAPISTDVPAPTPALQPVSGAIAAPSTPAGVPGTWTPVFTDEFDGTSVDSTKWATNWFGGTEMNGYEKSAANVTVADGVVSLAVSGTPGNESGAILTSNSENGSGATTGFDLQVGQYAEARIHFPGDGSTVYNWPAWWANGRDWPYDGEADIFEGMGTAMSVYNYADPVGGRAARNSGTIPGLWSDGFHTYGLKRFATYNEVYWDGELVFTYPTSDEGAAQYLILTNGEGFQAVTGEASTMKVDYVRVWELGR